MLRLLQNRSDPGLLFRGRTKLQSIDIEEFIHSLTQEIVDYHSSSQVNIEIENKITVPITTDATLLKGITLNLIENSIVFRGVNAPFVKCIF